MWDTFILVKRYLIETVLKTMKDKLTNSGKCSIALNPLTRAQGNGSSRKVDKEVYGLIAEP
ncbi:hypothetical protein QFZ97_005439 [Paraburkholderia youngii]